MSYQLELEHQRVSLEMSNPFSQIGQYAHTRLSNFMRQATTDAMTVISGLTSNQSGRDTGSIPAGAIQQISTTYSFSDIARVQVFVPSTLKPKVTVDAYAAAVLKQLTIAQDIIDFAGQEIIDTVRKYISLPGRLGDLNAPDSGEVTLDILGRIEKLRSEFETLTTATGTQTQRPYSEAFRRNLDYVKAMKDTRDIEQMLNQMLNKLPAYKKQMEEANKVTKELMVLIEKKPEEYALGNVAGARLGNLALAFAQEAEYVGASIQTARVLIKSMADTHVIIAKATERFNKKI